MKTIVTIAAIFVALIFLFAGTLKLIKARQIENNIGNTVSFSQKGIYRFIAIIEIIVSFLFVIPYELGIVPSVSHFAALAMAVLIIGAPVTHYKMGEHAEAALTTLLLIVILVISFNRIFV